MKQINHTYSAWFSFLAEAQTAKENAESHIATTIQERQKAEKTKSAQKKHEILLDALIINFQADSYAIEAINKYQICYQTQPRINSINNKETQKYLVEAISAIAKAEKRASAIREHTEIQHKTIKNQIENFGELGIESYHYAKTNFAPIPQQETEEFEGFLQENTVYTKKDANWVLVKNPNKQAYIALSGKNTPAVYIYCTPNGIHINFEGKLTTLKWEWANLFRLSEFLSNISQKPKNRPKTKS